MIYRRGKAFCGDEFFAKTPRERSTQIRHPSQASRTHKPLTFRREPPVLRNPRLCFAPVRAFAFRFSPFSPLFFPYIPNPAHRFHAGAIDPNKLVLGIYVNPSGISSYISSRAIDSKDFAPRERTMPSEIDRFSFAHSGRGPTFRTFSQGAALG